MSTVKYVYIVICFCLTLFAIGMESFALEKANQCRALGYITGKPIRDGQLKCVDKDGNKITVTFKEG